MSPFCDLGRQRKSAGQESEETDQYTAKGSDAGDGGVETDRVREGVRSGGEDAATTAAGTAALRSALTRTWMEKMHSGRAPGHGLRSRPS